MIQINLVRAGYRSVVRGLLLTTVAVAGVAIATGGAFAAAPGTNVLVNGGFETPAVTRPALWDTKFAGAATLAPWVIGGNSINHVKGYWQPGEGVQSLDLNGNGPGSVAQVVPTEPGRSYLLRFKYARNPTASSARRR